MIPGLGQPVCAERVEHYCITAPCNQPWYDRCSPDAACRDRAVTGYVPGACIDGAPSR